MWEEIVRDALVNRNFVTSSNDMKRWMKEIRVSNLWTRKFFMDTCCLSSLNKGIRQPLVFHHLPTLYQAYKMTLKVEGYQKENKSRVQSSTSSSWDKNNEVWKPSPTRDKSKGANTDIKSKFDKGKHKLEYKDLGNKANLGTPSKIKYFKCQGYGQLNVLIEELSLH